MNKSALVLAALIVSPQVLASNHGTHCTGVAGPDLGGDYPRIYEKAAYEAEYACSLMLSGNPAIAELNAQIAGNPAELPPVAERLPAEPLVIAPYTAIGVHGGVLDGISKATEAGTSDLLSVRHTNLVRFSDDLSTIVPNVASSWQWNDDFTALTFTLREGHKWSDGDDFTAEDIAFWYNHMILDSNIIESPAERYLSAGEPMTVVAVDAVTVRFELNAPRPGLLGQIATDYSQYFQPMHLLSQFHPAFNPEADALAASVGFDSGYEVINFYYGQSDWKDVPSPLLKDAAKAEALVAAGYTAVAPTLESHIVVEETLEGRRLVANPYFFQIDTQGQQLPYINAINEVYIGDEDIQTAKMIAGEIEYKAQSVNLPSAPVLLENREAGNYEIALRPTIAMSVIGLNMTTQNAALAEAFADLRVRRAMSHALNRDRMNETAFFGLGTPTQYTGFDADTAPFVTAEQRNAHLEYAPEQAAALLDAAGLVDSDGDGVRELADGQDFTLTYVYATQGVATELMELIAADWTDVGIRTTIKEVTSDEYRASQSANELDLHMWTKGQPLAVLSADTAQLVPPYGSFFDLRNGMEWARYIDTNGAEGVEPPATVDEMRTMAAEFVTLEVGSEASNALGQQIAQRVVDDLFFIGTVKAVSPIYFHNTLMNFEVPKTSSYEYYRVYPYLPSQWFIAE